MKTANQNIGCTVTDCVYHCTDKDYCSLSQVHIGAQCKSPASKHSVDCESFKCKKDSCC